MNLRDKTALVTGASSGLGADFARLLAEGGANLILVARRVQPLEELAALLRSNYSVRVEVVSADLGQAEQRLGLCAQLKERGLTVDILVNNAGLGVYGDFSQAEWSRLEQMLQVDILALTHLTHLFLPEMRQRGWGRVLQVASTASFQPCPSYAAYAAAKSYVLSFSLALNHELRHSGVTCTTLCPGVTETEFFQVSGQKLTFFQKLSMMKSPAVARIGLQAMVARRPYVVAGRLNTMLALSTRFAPTNLVVALAARLMK